MRSKPKRGSTLMLVLVLCLCGMGMVSQMRLAANLGYGSVSDADNFSKKQTANSACDVCVVQLCRDLHAVTLFNDSADSWIGASGSAVYSLAVDAIFDVVMPSGKWTCIRLDDALSAVGLGDVETQKMFNELAETGVVSLSVTTPEGINIDWTNPENRVSRRQSKIAIDDVTVLVELNLGSQTVMSTYQVSGLLMEVERETGTGRMSYCLTGNEEITLLGR